MLNILLHELERLKNPSKAAVLQRFFKTGKGEYSEGDVFLGITVPLQRKVAANYRALPLPDIEKLLRSPVHEHRLIALLILISQYEHGTTKEKEQRFRFYLAHTARINNWDLVDLSSHELVGTHLLDKDRAILRKLAKSRNIWERRIAIVSTYAFIRQRQLKDTFELATMLLADRHDLIHKAVGWMLREAGKRDEKMLIAFLEEHRKSMPRTMLRYAIERFPKEKRDYFLRG